MNEVTEQRALTEKIRDRDALAGIIGLGYVGLPLVAASVAGGYRTLGFDIEEHKVADLNAGHSYMRTVDDTAIKALLDTGRFEATSDFSRLSNCDVILVCVPTPLTEAREPDLSFVLRTVESVASALHAGQLIILTSTTYPGTTNEVVKPVLERSGLVEGEDFYLAYSPEREDPGNADFDTRRTPRIVSGTSSPASELARQYFQAIVDQVVPVTTPEVAEAAKLTENVFRAVNVALANELKVILGRMNIDVWEVIDAAATKPFGFMPFYPGPGLGGHCIPIDPFYLAWRARSFGTQARFIELAGEVNAAMPSHVAEVLESALRDRGRATLSEARIVVLGVAYKRDVDDTRESPGLAILDLLLSRGAAAVYYDPYVPVIPVTRKYPQLAGIQSLGWADVMAGESDACLILTDHTKVDYEALVDTNKLIVDTRNATRHVVRYRERIVLA